MRPDPRLEQMVGDVPGSGWPPVFSTRVSALAALVHQLDRTQWLHRRVIQAAQHRQLASLAGYFAQHSPHFRDRLKASGIEARDLATPAGLHALAPLTRQQAQVKDPPIVVNMLPDGHGPIQIHNTSGSTGEPVIVHRTAVNRLFWLAITLRYHLWAEPNFDGRICAIRAHLKKFGEQPDWGAPVSLFFRTGKGMLVNIETDVAAQLDIVERFRPNSLVVYPSNLVALLDEMDRRGLELPELKRFRTVSETLFEGLRERVAERGAVISDCYSSEEMGYIALQCPESDLYHVMAESVILEVVDEEGRPCAEGQPGRVLVTDIQNHATPMIRYEIRDYAELGPRCPCGRGLPTIRFILGRERNMIVKPDGTRHWPLTGYKKFREIAPVAQYQFRQHAPDRIEVRLVTERPLTDTEEAALRAVIQEKLRYPFDLDFVYFEGRLPLGANGKFEEVMRLF